MIVQGDVVELLTVPCLQGAVHAEVEQSMTILHHRVHIIAGKRLVRLVLFLKDTELVTVVAVDTVTGGSPQESIMVEIDLSNETTGQLLIVSCKEFAHLSTHTHSQA